MTTYSTSTDLEPPERAAAAPIANAADRRPWQFSLRAMMIFTAGVAAAAWLATIKGAGVLVVVAGLAICVLNGRGALAAWQRPERCGRPIKLGWFLLVVSLCLPAMRGCNNDYIFGWQTAYVTAAQQCDILRGTESLQAGLEYVLITIMNLTNLLLLASPLLLILLRRGRGQGYAAFLACGAAAAWTVPVPDPNGLLIGYYVWCLAQLMILSAVRIGPRTLAAMSAIAIVRVFLWPQP